MVTGGAVKGQDERLHSAAPLTASQVTHRRSYAARKNMIRTAATSALTFMTFSQKRLCWGLSPCSLGLKEGIAHKHAICLVLHLNVQPYSCDEDQGQHLC